MSIAKVTVPFNKTDEYSQITEKVSLLVFKAGFERPLRREPWCLTKGWVDPKANFMDKLFYQYVRYPVLAGHIVFSSNGIDIACNSNFYSELKKLGDLIVEELNINVNIWINRSCGNDNLMWWDRFM